MWGGDIIHHYSFLYADDGLIASTDPVWIQEAFDTLTGLFDRLELYKKFNKTVGMLCCPYFTVVTQLEADYDHHMM